MGKRVIALRSPVHHQEEVRSLIEYARFCSPETIFFLPSKRDQKQPMPISIILPLELEEKLLETASEAGMEVNQYVVKILEGKLQPVASKAKGKAERESELLQKITLGIPVTTWKRYDYLKGLRDRASRIPL